MIIGPEDLEHRVGMTQTLLQASALTDNSKKQSENKNATKNLDYTTIVDRFRTVSCSDDSDPTGVVYMISTIPLTVKAVLWKPL